MPREKGLTIRSVAEGSPAEEAGIRPGDRLIAIDRHPVRDIIDVQFYADEDVLRCTVLRGSKKQDVRLEIRDGESPGMEFEEMRFRCCGNHCVFCFIDQNPEGMRPSIYFKDEDYRLSFLYGNYVTLTAAKREDLKRIVEQRLSPIYISIHAANAKVRKRMLGLDRDDFLLEKIGFLTEYGIEIHGQVVLCPGWNDDEVLAETLESLSAFYPGLRSLSVVPVGLTRHRQGLPELEGVDADAAVRVAEDVSARQNAYADRLEEPFVYLADEFYLLAGVPLPPLAHYGDFWQLDNGVGMVRHFLTEFEAAAERFPEGVSGRKRLTLATGMLAEPMLAEHVLPRLRKIENLEADLVGVSNRFFGETVTVSGLLTGRDIRDAFQDKQRDTILLPPNCVNADGVFLDDLTPEEISRSLNTPVLILEDFDSLWSLE